MKSRCIGKWTITKPTNDGSCRYITYDTSDVEEVRAAGRRGWGIAQHIEVDFGGDPTIEDRSKEEAAQVGYSRIHAGQEPVAIYHGNGIIDCGDAGHHNIELLKMIPAGAKLYKDPSAEIAALRERIAGMEKDADDLRKFLDVAAGEGYEFDGVDAGDLYLRLFPDAFDAAISKEPKP